MGDRHYPSGILLGRARVPGQAHPRIVTVRNGDLLDITANGETKRERIGDAFLAVIDNFFEDG